MIKLLACLVVASVGSMSVAALADPCDRLPASAFKAESRGPDWERRASNKAEKMESREALVLGDSIVSLYPPKLANELSLYGVNVFGMGGDGVQNLMWRLKNFGYDRTNAASVYFVIGGEDVGKMKPKDIANGIFASICQVGKKLGRTPYAVVASLLPQGKDLSAHADSIMKVNEILSDSAKRYGYRYADVNAAIRAQCGYQQKCALYTDSYNLSQKGYRVLTEVLDAGN